MNPDNTQRPRPYEDEQAMPDSGMPQMLGIGLVFVAVVAGLVFYNATSDHGATATNATAPQHAAPAPQTKTQ